ncbi:MAG TPA: response regulator [Candidatus Paceibacterota bacterium]|nr:response regulator [Candidatus Paceibacterota bacterium]
MNTQKTILIVEDEKDIREALRDVLENNQYLVLEAKNGKEGVTAALEHHPDLILLDLLMPEMDGMAALTTIRSDVWGKDAPVIILTNLNANNEHLVADVVSHKPLYYLIKSDWNIGDVLKKIEETLNVSSEALTH